MCDRIKACVDARTDQEFVVVARTDALANEGLAASIERAQRYMEAGADMIFAEACATLEQYSAFAQALPKPRSLLANITEFSLTPAFSMPELGQAGVAAALFPLSAARAMAAAALNVYQAILRDGTPRSLLHTMQPRAELYEFLDYERYERVYDRLASPESDDRSS
jgi:methylisocitrate lyase